MMFQSGVIGIECLIVAFDNAPCHEAGDRKKIAYFQRIYQRTNEQQDKDTEAKCYYQR